MSRRYAAQMCPATRYTLWLNTDSIIRIWFEELIIFEVISDTIINTRQEYITVLRVYLFIYLFFERVLSIEQADYSDTATYLCIGDNGVNVSPQKSVQVFVRSKTQ